MGVHGRTCGTDYNRNEFKVDQPEVGKCGEYCTGQMAAGGGQNRAYVGSDEQNGSELHIRYDEPDPERNEFHDQHD